MKRCRASRFRHLRRNIPDRGGRPALTPGGRTVTDMNLNRPALLAASVLLLGLGIFGCGGDGSTTDRQTEVREAGAEVMPFDLDKTRHSFVKTDDGGVQTVVALDASDTDQVSLVREHLSEIRDEFAAGRFDDPTTIHGADMPGVADLAAGAALLEITYRELDGGAELTYRTVSGPMVAALHDWFDAQVDDHGSDAVSESGGHVMTEEMWNLHHPGQPYPGSMHDE